MSSNRQHERHSFSSDMTFIILWLPSPNRSIFLDPFMEEPPTGPKRFSTEFFAYPFVMCLSEHYFDFGSRIR